MGEFEQYEPACEAVSSPVLERVLHGQARRAALPRLLEERNDVPAEWDFRQWCAVAKLGDAHAARCISNQADDIPRRSELYQKRRDSKHAITGANTVHDFRGEGRSLMKTRRAIIMQCPAFACGDSESRALNAARKQLDAFVDSEFALANLDIQLMTGHAGVIGAGIF